MRAIASLAVRVLGMTSAVVSMSCTAAPQHAAVQPPGFPNLGNYSPVSVDAFLAEPGR